MGPTWKPRSRPLMPEGIRRLAVIGGGGHGRVVIDLLRTLGWGPIGVIDIDPSVADRLPPGVAYLGTDRIVEKMSVEETLLVNGIGSIGPVVARRRIFEGLAQRGFTFATLRHPSAVVAADVVLEPGAQLMAGSIVQTGARIGRNVLINTRASVDHDCIVGDHCHLAPGVVLSGGVRVGAGSHLGTGAVVIQNVSIGADAVVSAGSIVKRDIEPGATYLHSS